MAQGLVGGGDLQPRGPNVESVSLGTGEVLPGARALPMLCPTSSALRPKGSHILHSGSPELPFSKSQWDVTLPLPTVPSA